MSKKRNTVVTVAISYINSVKAGSTVLYCTVVYSTQIRRSLNLVVTVLYSLKNTILFCTVLYIFEIEWVELRIVLHELIQLFSSYIVIHSGIYLYDPRIKH